MLPSPLAPVFVPRQAQLETENAQLEKRLKELLGLTDMQEEKKRKEENEAAQMRYLMAQFDAKVVVKANKERASSNSKKSFRNASVGSTVDSVGSWSDDGEFIPAIKK